MNIVLEKKEEHNFQRELEGIKISITKVLYSLFFMLTLSSLAILFLKYVINQDPVQSNYIFIVVGLVFFFGILQLVVIFRLNRDNYKRALLFLIFSFFIVTIFSAFTTGTYSTIHFPFIITSVLTISIVFGTKKASFYIGIVTILFLIISYLHNNGIVSFVVDKSSSDFEDTAIIFIMIGVIVRIADIAYAQIEESYFKALQYSKQLEILNQDLDKKVKLRTIKLKENYENQIENMHSSAILGSITKPLIHDIATPVSAIKGGLDLLMSDKKYDPMLVELIANSADQMSSIINETRDLMRGKNIIEVFETSHSIKKVLKILKNEFIKHEIKIEFLDINGFQIKGSTGLFERILINLIINAIEELRQKEGERKIVLGYRINADKLEITVTDNGRGIKPEFIDLIFKEDFSLKHSTHNLGLGLSFVKHTMIEKFQGDIYIESVVSKFATFILQFPLINEKKYNIKQN